MSTLKTLFERNSKWAEKIEKKQPGFFAESAQGQAPDYLWVGCSDSRVPANTISNSLPGEIFVHRNIANVIAHDDINSMSVIQYAVEVLKVKHVIVCGHYGCGGVKASLDDQNHGLIDHWLRHIEDVYLKNREQLEGLEGDEKVDRLCELNVFEQVNNISRSSFIKHAWLEGEDLTVHGIIYDLETGTLNDLNYSISSLNELEEIQKGA